MCVCARACMCVCVGGTRKRPVSQGGCPRGAQAEAACSPVPRPAMRGTNRRTRVPPGYAAFIAAERDRSVTGARLRRRCCRAAITLLSRCCHAAVTLLSRCCHAAVTLLSRCCHAAVTLLSRCCHAAVTLLSRCCHAASRCCHAAVTLLSRCCQAAVALLSGCCRAAVTLRSRCGHAAVTLLRRCCRAAVALLRRCCHAAVTLLSRCFTLLSRCCGAAARGRRDAGTPHHRPRPPHPPRRMRAAGWRGSGEEGGPSFVCCDWQSPQQLAQVRWYQVIHYRRAADFRFRMPVRLSLASYLNNRC